MTRSISIACWLVVYVPQIIKNYLRSSADGLSLAFVLIWLLGDLFNVLGAILQGVLPTMMILAFYYAIADVVLLGQCLWYRTWTRGNLLVRWGKNSDEDLLRDDISDETPLLWRETSTDAGYYPRPALDPVLDNAAGADSSPAPPVAAPTTPASSSNRSLPRSIIFNTLALVAVCSLGILGWILSPPSPSGKEDASSRVHMSAWGQIFGYACAALYLSSRLPQLLLNYRNKSTEGISALFFLFACVGNLSFVLSILAYQPACARPAGIEQRRCAKGEWGREYRTYLLVNASWIAGSAGTLLFDLMVFVQFWWYRGNSGPGP